MNPDETFNIPAWSISTEFWAYIVFAGVVFALGRRQVLGAAAIVLAAGAALFLTPDGMRSGNGPIAFARCLFGFFVGVIFYAVYIARPQWSGGPARYVAAACVVTFLVVNDTIAWNIAFPLLSATLILLVGNPRWLTTRPMLWLGRISYSVYMVHLAVIWLMDQAVRFLLRPRLVHVAFHTDVLDIHPILGNALTLVAVVIVVTLAHLSHKWIEEPARVWSRRALARDHAPIAVLQPVIAAEDHGCHADLPSRAN
jgi:peptidoglycan/LPS O-acetylase OafA/YrhL